MSETEISNLELQIDNFVKSYQKLALENTALEKRLNALSKERLLLIDRKKKAADILRKLIIQLKDELLCQQQK
ncbi:MAG: hypothetical protein M1561_05390 [Gammaproteobacteria bacterium]|nr:hypothetical protein [Gammaproteobacteria bacterium]